MLNSSNFDHFAQSQLIKQNHQLDGEQNAATNNAHFRDDVLDRQSLTNILNKKGGNKQAVN